MADPGDCASLAEVRAGIDQLDDELIRLLSRRVAYIERAAELKPAAGVPANAPARVTEVMLRVEEGARRQALPVDLATALWRTMIDWAIAHKTRLMSRSAPTAP